MSDFPKFSCRTCGKSFPTQGRAVTHSEDAGHEGIVEGSPPPGVPAPKVRPPCKFFAKGFCRRGDECPFEHGAALSLADQSLKPKKKKAKCKFFGQNRGCPKGQTCSFKHSLPSPLAASTVPVDPAMPVVDGIPANAFATSEEFDAFKELHDRMVAAQETMRLFKSKRRALAARAASNVSESESETTGSWWANASDNEQLGLPRTPSKTSVSGSRTGSLWGDADQATMPLDFSQPPPFLDSQTGEVSD